MEDEAPEAEAETDDEAVAEAETAADPDAEAPTVFFAESVEADRVAFTTGFLLPSLLSPPVAAR
jgi:hypothetical protein